MFRLVPIDGNGIPSDVRSPLPQAIRESCEATAALYRKTGYAPPWIGYLALLDDVIVGGGAFVGPPDRNRVEIAYFTLEDHQGRGMAARTASALVSIARRANPDIELFAKTLPVLNPSTTILARLGFRQIENVVDEDIGEAWAWLLTARRG